MPPDDSKPTSKDEPAQPQSWEEWWAEDDSPAARRKWSPERRKDEAEFRRMLRAMKKAGAMDDWSKDSFEFEGRVITIACRLPDPSYKRPDRPKSGGRKR